MFQALSLVGITFGFFLYLHPDSFVHEAKDNHEQLAEERSTQEYAQNFSPEENLTDITVTSTTDLIEDITTAIENNPSLHYQNIIKYIRNEGIEGGFIAILIPCCTMFSFSHYWMFPEAFLFSPALPWCQKCKYLHFDSTKYKTLYQFTEQTHSVSSMVD